MRVKYEHNSDTDIKALILHARGIEHEFDQLSFIDGNFVEHEIVGDDTLLGVSETIASGLAEGKKVVVFGDYDADGVCSAAIAKEYLDFAEIYIPERKDGYGLTESSLEKAGVLNSVVVTVDCGIRSREAVKKLIALGNDVIVTDHHEINASELPDCIVVHPALSKSRFTSYAGSGVAYKLFRAMYPRKASNRAVQLSAVGTICDMMPVLDENRRIIRDGLSQIQRNPIPGIAALFEQSKRDARYAKESDISFYIGPMINACGRMENARLAYDLLICDNNRDAKTIAEEVAAINERRKAEVKRIESSLDILYDGNIVIASISGELEGMVGIVANGLNARKKKPAIVISHNEGKTSASCRGPNWFDCNSLAVHLEKYTISGGGHKGAAGMVIKQGSISEFIDAIISYASDHVFYTATEITADIGIDVNDFRAVVREIERLRPFGHGFEAPTFASVITVSDLKIIGKDKNHARVTSDEMDFMFFGIDELFAESVVGKKLAVMYELGDPYNQYTRRPSVIVREYEKI